MYSHEFLLKDTHEIELEIERHCVGLGLDCSDQVQLRLFAHDLLRNIAALKEAASRGNREASAKVELFSMAVMMHEANTKAYGSNYLSKIKALSKRQFAWVAIAKAVWDELESRTEPSQINAP